MKMIICPCGAQMRCIKNSMNVRYESGTIYSADRFKCPDCDNGMAVTAKEPLPYGYNPERTEHDVVMKADQ